MLDGFDFENLTRRNNVAPKKSIWVLVVQVWYETEVDLPSFAEFITCSVTHGLHGKSCCEPIGSKQIIVQL
jgi:hypothetical protein